MRPLLARISLDALTHNLEIARRHAGSARILSVVKASAYGHGLARAARALVASDGFAVLNIDEAVQLRQMGIEQPILMLEGPFDAEEMAACAEFNLMPVLHSPHQLEWLGQAGKPLQVFVKINSGMNRLGFALADFETVVERVNAHPQVAEVALMTHFATADEDFGIDWQWQRFLEKALPTGLPISAANSAAILRYPETHRDWVRAGIMLYGASPFTDVSAAEVGLRPAMTLQSRIIALQSLKPGEAVGYGLTYMADEAVRVGIVACGYADGYPRHAPTGTPVLVNGRRTRTLGRVSMDMLAVDLTRLPDAGIGSPVVLWGEGMPVEDVARAAGTISYELLCALAPRVALHEE
ncbi:alanine racemase [Betaproteobacteria bacterium SCN2]|jgi:alanine racemase|nr:alanine racemase [Betaproteobacteria bacterium SCN2]